MVKRKALNGQVKAEKPTQNGKLKGEDQKPKAEERPKRQEFDSDEEAVS